MGPSKPAISQRMKSPEDTGFYSFIPSSVDRGPVSETNQYSHEIPLATSCLAMFGKGLRYFTIAYLRKFR